ncbi:hypothetical protein DFH09DRAFT_1309802 [Mycena vulgaris]|nr:hypothetical protein DFH09DRAFT_1309802 [Mycena vulgaris]
MTSVTHALICLAFVLLTFFHDYIYLLPLTVSLSTRRGADPVHPQMFGVLGWTAEKLVRVRVKSTFLFPSSSPPPFSTHTPARLPLRGSLPFAYSHYTIARRRASAPLSPPIYTLSRVSSPFPPSILVTRQPPSPPPLLPRMLYFPFLDPAVSSSIFRTCARARASSFVPRFPPSFTPISPPLLLLLLPLSLLPPSSPPLTACAPASANANHSHSPYPPAGHASRSAISLCQGPARRSRDVPAHPPCANRVVSALPAVSPRALQRRVAGVAVACRGVKSGEMTRCRVRRVVDVQEYIQRAGERGREARMRDACRAWSS